MCPVFLVLLSGSGQYWYYLTRIITQLTLTWSVITRLWRDQLTCSDTCNDNISWHALMLWCSLWHLAHSVQSQPFRESHLYSVKTRDVFYFGKDQWLVPKQIWNIKGPAKIVNLCRVFSLDSTTWCCTILNCLVAGRFDHQASQGRAETGHFWANNDVYRH